MQQISWGIWKEEVSDSGSLLEVYQGWTDAASAGDQEEVY